jgi:CheY-like chemotaxis protein
MIRVLVVDDHPAVRTGVVSLLRSEPGSVAVGAAANAADGLEEAGRTRPVGRRTLRDAAPGGAWGGRAPSAPPAVMERCLARLRPDDVPLFGMAINGTPTHEIAAVSGDDIATTRSRLRTLVRRLQATDEAASFADH